MLFKKILEIIYPNVCVICGRKINENQTYTCEKCTNILKYSKNERICKNLIKNCIDIEEHSIYVNTYADLLISLFLYKGMIRNKILDFKFNNKPYIAKMFGKLLADYILDLKVKIDVIIPVPIHIKRYLDRGYNQSELLSKEISKNINIYHATNILKKVKNTVAQSTLSMSKRKANVIGTYKIINEEKIKDKVILLVDDVYTTGATAGECSKLLKENGASSVIVATIAYSKFSKEDF